MPQTSAKWGAGAGLVLEFDWSLSLDRPLSCPVRILQPGREPCRRGNPSAECRRLPPCLRFPQQGPNLHYQHSTHTHPAYGNRGYREAPPPMAAPAPLAPFVSGSGLPGSSRAAFGVDGRRFQRHFPARGECSQAG